METLKRFWPWFIFVPLAIAALVLTVVGITTHEEAGLELEIAPWEPGDFPLVVCGSRYGTEYRGAPEVDDAVRALNTRLGAVAFVSDEADVCNVTVLLGTPLDVAAREEPGGAMHFILTPEGRQICEVRTLNVHGAREVLVIQHELGHCLGLGHDDFASSIMAPIQPHEDPGFGWPAALTDHDVALLRELYLLR